jgi:hypothetical protein
LVPREADHAGFLRQAGHDPWPAGKGGSPDGFHSRQPRPAADHHGCDRRRAWRGSNRSGAGVRRRRGLGWDDNDADNVSVLVAEFFCVAVRLGKLGIEQKRTDR